jgi:hypothetical protein
VERRAALAAVVALWALQARLVGSNLVDLNLVALHLVGLSLQGCMGAHLEMGESKWATRCVAGCKVGAALGCTVARLLEG